MGVTTAVGAVEGPGEEEDAAITWLLIITPPACSMSYRPSLDPGLAEGTLSSGTAATLQTNTEGSDGGWRF